jgi:hypothetical protein
MNTNVIWLTYDLGVAGDFQGIYSWLDDHNAVECGNNVAFIKYNYPESIKTDIELNQYLKKELEKKVNLVPSNRVYIIMESIEEKKTYGRFLIGKRKGNPWEGFGSKTDNTIDK